MKNILSENMLRFGAKNLSESNKKRLTLESILQTIQEHGLTEEVRKKLSEQAANYGILAGPVPQYAADAMGIGWAKGKLAVTAAYPTEARPNSFYNSAEVVKKVKAEDPKAIGYPKVLGVIPDGEYPFTFSEDGPAVVKAGKVTFTYKSNIGSYVDKGTISGNTGGESDKGYSFVVKNGYYSWKNNQTGKTFNAMGTDNFRYVADVYVQGRTEPGM